LSVWDFSRIEPTVDEGLGIAEHLVDHEWFAVYGLFGYPADGRGNDWRGPAGPDWVTGPIERRQFNRPRDDYFGRGANNASFFAIPIGIAGEPDQTPGALERSAVIPFAARHITISILRSSRRLRLATEKRLERADLQFRAELFNLF